MKEASIRLQLHHALMWLGYWPLHHRDGFRCPKCGTIQVPPIVGRPDTEARHPRFPTALIEVKAVKELAFAFSEITIEQREYLSSWSKEHGESYLCLGKIVPMGTKTKIDSIVVIPWQMWLVEEANHEKSVPYDRLYYKNELRSEESTIVGTFDPRFFLEKRDGDPHFKADHPLAVCQEVEVPFYKRSKEK